MGISRAFEDPDCQGVPIMNAIQYQPNNEAKPNSTDPMSGTKQSYQVMPELSSEDYRLLYDDMAHYGQRCPIDVDENGATLDGHHRLKICRELGIEPILRVVRGLEDREKREFAIAVNLARRHLTPAQKRDLIGEVLMASPEKSNREIGRLTKSNHETVEVKRKELESGGGIRHQHQRVGKDGVAQPSVKTVTPKPTTQPSSYAEAKGEAQPEIPASQSFMNGDPPTSATNSAPVTSDGGRSHKYSIESRRKAIVNLISSNMVWTRDYGHERGDSTQRERDWIATELDLLTRLRDHCDKSPWAEV